ncbi:hypothetical protein SAMN02745148_01625 [Modicisalibacter ilicicola DSM 19980]|uniref:Uncharacterized protein n=1 Tax=Modicisalibacter ilicicola DSM 19980 TaxID=1121942 RepID=A0A1M4Y898_9GAMM|nr:hypothetical protein [Halomonas ilicicola]SHF02037.1 hypothetical protein SAMN02745148_01625 [Halomonas ilicicola DSM 19980]
MTETLIWLVVFAVILIMTLRSWNGGLGRFFERRTPQAFRGGRDDRWIWCIALAVLGATFIVKPISMLMTLLLLALIIWIGFKVVRWGLSKTKTY